MWAFNTGCGPRYEICQELVALEKTVNKQEHKILSRGRGPETFAIFEFMVEAQKDSSGTIALYYRGQVNFV